MEDNDDGIPTMHIIATGEIRLVSQVVNWCSFMRQTVIGRRGLADGPHFLGSRFTLLA